MSAPLPESGDMSLPAETRWLAALKERDAARALAMNAEFRAVRLEAALRALADHIEFEHDITNSGGPNWAMSLSNEFGNQIAAALSTGRGPVEPEATASTTAQRSAAPKAKR